MEAVGDQAHCMDQWQVHSPHDVELPLLPGQEPSLCLEDIHYHTCFMTNFYHKNINISYNGDNKLVDNMWIVMEVHTDIRMKIKRANGERKAEKIYTDFKAKWSSFRTFNSNFWTFYVIIKSKSKTSLNAITIIKSKIKNFSQCNSTLLPKLGNCQN